MAIAFDAATPNNKASSATSLTYSHTCTGANLILFVAVYLEGGGDILTGVTYNGVAMTQIAKLNSDNAANFSYLYYLIAPATGAHNVVVSTSGTTLIDSSSVSYTGAKQSAQPDASTSQKVANGSSTATSLTTVADNSWTILSVAGDRNATAGTGSTQRISPATNNIGMYDSNAVIHPAGSTSMTVSTASGGFDGYIMASFAPLASTAYTQTLTETATISNSLIKTVTRALTEAVADTDTFIGLRVRNALFSETQSTVATLIKATTKLLTDTQATADTVIKTVGRALSEAQATTATIIKTIGRALSDAVASIDTAAKTAARLFTEALATAHIAANLIEASHDSTQDGLHTLYGTSVTKVGEAFTASVTANLVAAQFAISKLGSPTGDIVAKLYALTGTYGTNATPTGGALATSDVVAASSITTHKFYTFTFTGAQQYALTANSQYGISVEYSGGDASNNISVWRDSGNSSSGNYYYDPGSGYTALTGQELDFYVYYNIGLTATRIQNKLLSETAVAADALIRVIGHKLSEVATSTAILIKTPSRALTEAVTSADTLLRAMTHVLSENVTGVDIFIRTIGRKLTDAATITDFFAGLRVQTATLTDPITFTDTLAIIKAYGRTFTEAVIHVDTFIHAIARAFREAATLTATALNAPGKTLSENVTFTDKIRRFINGAEILLTNIAKSAASTLTSIAKRAATLTGRAKHDATLKNIEKP